MKVIYKCTCQLAEQVIDVPDRRPTTDVITWMEMVTNCIGFDHAEMSPRCQETAMTYAKIPIEGEQIGVRETRN